MRCAPKFTTAAKGERSPAVPGGETEGGVLLSGEIPRGESARGEMVVDGARTCGK
jgi:hypothetical protein